MEEVVGVTEPVETPVALEVVVLVEPFDTESSVVYLCHTNSSRLLAGEKKE